VLAALHRRLGDLDACKAAALSGLRVCRAVKLRDGRWREAVSHLLGALGMVFMSGRRLVVAERCFRQAVRAVDEKTHPAAASIALNTLAAALFARGDLEGARRTFLASLALKEREGNLHELVIAHNNLAEVELRLGEHGSALTQAQRAVRLGEQIEAAADLPDCYRNLADAKLAAGDRRGALEASARALDTSLTEGGRVYLPEVALGAARISAAILPTETPGTPLHEAALVAARRVMSSVGDLDPARVEACRALLGRFLGSSPDPGA
jgi:tetratricopeptide (TPR) repeat protein